MIRQNCSPLAEQKVKSARVLPTWARAWGYRRTEMPRSYFFFWHPNWEQMEKNKGAPRCSRESWDQWPFVEWETGRVSSSLPPLAPLPCHPSHTSNSALKWSGAPLNGMSSGSPAYLEGLLSIWIVLYTNLTIIYQSESENCSTIPHHFYDETNTFSPPFLGSLWKSTSTYKNAKRVGLCRVN